MTSQHIDFISAEGVAVRLRALNAAGYTYAQLNVMLGRERTSSFARTLAGRDRSSVPKHLATAVFAIPWPPRPTDQRWWEDAACKGWALQRFFPNQGEQPSAETLACCASCPVRTQCLDEALANPDEVGVRGGTTREQRNKLRRMGRHKR